ncbi:lysosomal amino acid transporter 1 homolog isoform X2 [Bos taurus]|uniref:lysosomal amino acid transporter 1 homolog isoform X2 n=1 Tax=Bos taurus TaxID=9913 RepID=UPI000572BA91|nr:lysosomal amino acid transporter 1 homolog isoform X2 [Bos taurus]
MWSGGSLPRRELGALALHPWPLRGTEQPPPPSALHEKGDHWLCHRLRVQRAVPVLPAASDPHQLPAEVDPGDLVLAVRLGDAGEHAVWTERAAQKPRGGPERRQLRAAPPALARGQPGRPAARHHHLRAVLPLPARRPLVRAPAAPPQLNGTAEPGLGAGPRSRPGRRRGAQNCQPSRPPVPPKARELKPWLTASSRKTAPGPVTPTWDLSSLGPEAALPGARGRAAVDTHLSEALSPATHLPHCPSPPWHPPPPKKGPRLTQACSVHCMWPSKRYSQVAYGGLPSPDARLWGTGRDGSQAPGGPEGSECGRSRPQGAVSAGLSLLSLLGLWVLEPVSSVMAPYLVVRTQWQEETLQQGVPTLRRSARSRTVKIQTLVLHLSFPVPHLPHLCNGTVVPPLHVSF